MDTSDRSNEFQTPPEIARYMADMIPEHSLRILEPSPGTGNLISAVLDHPKLKHCMITGATNFFRTIPEEEWYDCIIMNPPFSAAHAFGIPEHLDLKGMKVGYYFLEECMKLSNHVIALMPIFTITDSDVRNRAFKAYGLKSITSLPRKTFQYTRIQTCILELDQTWKGPTEFKFY